MDAKSRCFPAALALFVARRDRRCRVAYCNGHVEHIDHILAHRSGGATTAENGEGLCRLHNLVKELPGWKYRRRTEFGDITVIDVITPSGREHRSASPPAVGFRPAGESALETELAALINAA